MNADKSCQYCLASSCDAWRVETRNYGGKKNSEVFSQQQSTTLKYSGLFISYFEILPS